MERKFAFEKVDNLFMAGGSQSVWESEIGKHAIDFNSSKASNLSHLIVTCSFVIVTKYVVPQDLRKMILN